MSINTNNYETYFLLYVDRELSEDERRMVEDFVRQYPHLEKELEILKQTVLIPPALLFENKDSLLREEKKRKLYPLYLMRVAATLLVLLTGAWFFFMTVNKNKKPVPAQVTDQNAMANAKSAAAAKGSDTNTKAVSPEKTLNPNLRSVNQGAATDAIAAMHATGLRNRKPGMISSKPDQANQQEQRAKAESMQDKGMDNETAAHPTLPQPSPDPDQQNIETAMLISDPSTVNRQQPTFLPSATNHQPSAPDDATSILLFNNPKPVTEFLKKLTARSPDPDATADNLRKKVRISVFQFSLNK